MYFYVALILCFIFLSISIEAQVVRATYGEECGGSTRCDFRAYLTCSSGKCECVIPETMIFDGEKCALLAGEDCNLSETETMPCIPDSICLNGLCACVSGFFKTENGTCNKALDYGAHCYANNQCDKERFLFCKENKCDCINSVATIETPASGKMQKCALISGATCDNNQDQCVPNAECINNVCQCNINYFPNSTGECERKRSFSESCTKDSECDKDVDGFPFICNSDGVCDCNSTRPIFSNQICAQSAGSDCVGYPYDNYCVDNSYCDPSQRKCTCGSSHFQTILGTCENKKSHGKSCNSSKECIKYWKLICSSSGVCECETPLVYDSLKGECVKTLGSKCGDELHIKCMTNADCTTTTVGRKNIILCQCKSGTEEVNGSCLVSYGGSCGLDNFNRCNEEQQGTVCMEGICSCKSGVFEEIKGVCVSGVFGLCENSMGCISNSHCSDPKGDYNVMKCICNDGFVQVDNECQPTIGQPCKYTEVYQNQTNVTFKGYCDPIAPLHCIDGTCQCRAEEEYDVGMRKCRGLFDSSCDPQDKNFCITNAECVSRWPYYRKTGKCTCKTGWQPNTGRKCVETITTSTMSIEVPPKSPTSPISDNIM